MTEDWLVAASKADENFLDVIDTAAMNLGFASLSDDVVEALAARVDLPAVLERAHLLNGMHPAFRDRALRSVNQFPSGVTWDPVRNLDDYTVGRASVTYPNPPQVPRANRLFGSSANTLANGNVAANTVTDVVTKDGMVLGDVFYGQFRYPDFSDSQTVMADGSSPFFGEIFFRQGQILQPTGNDFLRANLRAVDSDNAAWARQVQVTKEDGTTVSLFDWVTNEASLSELNGSPPGFTWHHHQDVGRMQLIDRDFHRWVRHLGGNSLWGQGRALALLGELGQ